MNSEKPLQLKLWIQIGIVCGLLVSIIYPLLIFVPLPDVLQITLIVFFGPLLSIASVGLYYFLIIHKKTIAASIAVVSNIIAGVLITLMFLVQTAIRSSKPQVIPEGENWIWNSFNHIHYGLDVTWDSYIFLGTFFFALVMFKHPSFGKIFSISGIAIAVAMISINIFSFPIPPGSASLIDMGPFIGLWYLAVTIRIMLAYKELLKKTIE